MRNDPIDYCYVIFRVLFTIVLICGITCTIYGGLNTNVQSAHYGPNQQIFIAGVWLLTLCAIAILIFIAAIIYEKCIENQPNLEPIVVVRMNKAKPLSRSIPKQAYYSNNV